MVDWRSPSIEEGISTGKEDGRYFIAMLMIIQTIANERICLREEDVGCGSVFTAGGWLAIFRSAEQPCSD
jgi:hypothetical protein